jgi:hypothetical protein
MPDEPDVMLGYLKPYFAAAIMRVISQWATFELDIDMLIWDLASLDPEPGACLTTQFPSVNARIDAVLALARLRSISASKIMELNEFRRSVDGPREKRNRLVHDPWFYGAESKQHYRLHRTARAKLDMNYKPITEEDLTAMLEEFRNLARRFSEISHAIRQELWTSPKMPLTEPPK